MTPASSSLGLAALSLFFLSASLGGCSPQADTSYRGEPLATLHGTIETANLDAGAVPAVEVALLWEHNIVDTTDLDSGTEVNHDLNPNAVGVVVPVTGQFPSAFSMELLTPPAAADLVPCAVDGTSPGHAGTAGIIALPAGTDPATLDASDIYASGEVYGTASGFVLVYADSDLAPGCFPLSWLTRGPLAKGYHLFEDVAPPLSTVLDDEPAYAACLESDAGSCAKLMPAPAGYVEVGFATSIALTLSTTPLPTPRATFTVGFPWQNGSDGGTYCLPQSMTIDPTTGEPDCHILAGFAGGPCPAGLVPADSARSTSIEESFAYEGTLVETVCELPIVPQSAWSDGSCAQSAEAGWCYLSGAAALPCEQRIVLSAPSSVPANNVFTSLSCLGP